jgi:diaminohydroxyphosphoribosylaminopyrimidine deaminase / 5-amino-6-(5-phosphoribosylamino)uracil reductase
MKNNDEHYMSIAINEAKKGMGLVKTNPIVGAVIVKDDKIISKGYHRKFGGDHAEIDALKKATNDVGRGSLYVTLEPCSTYGKTPPCVDEIIRNGIKRVVIGVLDPNPDHNGKAVTIFKKNNIRVLTGVGGNECENLIKPFVVNMQKKMPHVTLKLAMTMDGKIAAKTGNSMWVTDEHSRKYVHQIRHEVDAVMVGRNTVQTDNPSLTVRYINSLRQPDKIIFDSNLNLSHDLNVFSSIANERLFLIADQTTDKEKMKILADQNVIIIKKTSKSLGDILRQLYQYNIGTILLEGGSSLATSFFKEKLIDRVMFFYAPKIIGGDALNSIGGFGFDCIKDSIGLSNTSVTKLAGNDFLFEGDLNY